VLLVQSGFAHMTAFTYCYLSLVMQECFFLFVTVDLLILWWKNYTNLVNPDSTVHICES